MPLAGFTVSKGNMDFVPAVIAGVVGTVLGAFPWYFAGMYLGEGRLIQLADRYGKWLTVSGRDIETAIAWFNKYGGFAVFICRLVPGVRTLISLPAGLAHMNLFTFLLYSTAGTLIWTLLLTYAGFALGENYDLVDEYLGPVSKIVLGGLAIAFAVWIFLRYQKQKAR